MPRTGLGVSEMRNKAEGTAVHSRGYEGGEGQRKKALQKKVLVGEARNPMRGLIRDYASRLKQKLMQLQVLSYPSPYPLAFSSYPLALLAVSGRHASWP